MEYCGREKHLGAIVLVEGRRGALYFNGFYLQKAMTFSW